jgi:putative acetyltransferase
MPEIIFLTPDQALAARQTIYTVAHLVFPSGRTLEEDIAQFRQSWPLRDMDDIQRSYFDDGGTFMAVLEAGQIIGTGAFRRLEEGVCELKRFWLLPKYHGSGLAAMLLNRLFDHAREMGYHTMRLETNPHSQQRAFAFYKKLGFAEIPRYGDDVDDVGMEKFLLAPPQKNQPDPQS